MTGALCFAVYYAASCKSKNPQDVSLKNKKTECRNFIDAHGYKFFGLDFALIITAVALAILCSSHAIRIPGGTYGFSATAAGIFIADVVALVVVCAKSNKERDRVTTRRSSHY